MPDVDDVVVRHAQRPGNALWSVIVGTRENWNRIVDYSVIERQALREIDRVPRAQELPLHRVTRHGRAGRIGQANDISSSSGPSRIVGDNLTEGSVGCGRRRSVHQRY